MNKILNRDSNSISLASFYENHTNNKYNYNPSYQRESVWSDEKQSFLIDSIMRNFPIPPIFLRQKIDDSTGKTTFDVIDGKQRLTSIIRYIRDEIPISSEELPKDSSFEDNIAGLFFSELDESEDTKDYKKRFWRYSIPIEYIDTDSDDLIKHVFDRLNRNGESLTGQELRNAMYSENYFHKCILEVTKHPDYKEYLTKVDTIRMEDSEFISELFFEVAEKDVLLATQDEIDKLYKKYSMYKSSKLDNIFSEFKNIFDYLESLDCKQYCQKGVSHFYSIWCFSHYCLQNDIKSTDVNPKIKDFYNKYFSRNHDCDALISYKKAMSSNTKSKNQRVTRKNSLISYCIN